MFYVAVLVPFYTEWGHLNLTQVQFLQSWLMIWMFILNIPTGAIADRIGRKYSVASGGILLSISCVVYVLLPGFIPFLFAEFLAALGSSFVIGAGNALIYDFLIQQNRESEGKLVLGRSSAISSFGTIIAAPAGSFIASHFGIRMPMFLSAIPLFVASCIFLTLDEPKRSHEKSRPNFLDSMKNGIGFLFTNKKLQYFIANDLLVWTAAYFLIWLYQPMLMKTGLAIVYFGIIRSAFSLTGMIGTWNIHVTEKFFGTERMFVNATAFIVAAFLLLVALFPSVVTVVLAILFIGGFANARSSYLNAVMNEGIPDAQRATVLSVTSTITMLIFAIANPVVGFIADYSLRLAFLFIGLLPFTAFFFLRYQPMVHKRSVY